MPIIARPTVPTVPHEVPVATEMMAQIRQTENKNEDGEKILKKYSTLINPGKKIPSNIIKLTGIDDGMVKDAPYFEEVAGKIYEMFEGCYFMAHYAVFDFSFFNLK